MVCTSSDRSNVCCFPLQNCLSQRSSQITSGDIIVKHPLTEYRHELSSMGIRVDKESLLKQLDHRGVSHEATLGFQKAVVENRLPLSYGGGIGISRLLMLLLRTGHIGEVQCGLWHDEHFNQAMKAGVDLIPDRLVEPTT